MSAILEAATTYWQHVAPLLDAPRSESEYDDKVTALDELLHQVGDDENHPLASLAARLGDVIEAWDDTHRPIPAASDIDVLRYLMEEHGINQRQLPEIGAQPVVSAIFSGKRSLNWRQVCALAERFGVSADVFRAHDSARGIESGH